MKYLKLYDNYVNFDEDNWDEDEYLTPQEETFNMLKQVSKKFRWEPIITKKFKNGSVEIAYKDGASSTYSGSRISKDGKFSKGIHRLHGLTRYFKPKSVYQLECLFYLNSKRTKLWKIKVNKLYKMIRDGIDPFDAITKLDIKI